MITSPWYQQRAAAIRKFYGNKQPASFTEVWYSSAQDKCLAREPLDDETYIKLSKHTQLCAFEERTIDAN